jgi:hypothetical protein
MPSKFPGMDPFIEGQEWESFHLMLLSELVAALAPKVRSRYTVHVEKRVVVERPGEGASGRIIPDSMVVHPSHRIPAVGSAAATLDAPVLATIPLPERVEQRFLELRFRETGNVVTVIEVLSPSNKRPGSELRDDYLAKREAVMMSTAHLVEIDLLRGGQRLPLEGDVPEAPYYVVRSRFRHRPAAEVWPISLRQRLPSLAVPLMGSDPDVVVDLQELVDHVYDRVDYGYVLDYSAPPVPPLSAEDAEWVREILGT